jgi:hypothetical protein
MLEHSGITSPRVMNSEHMRDRATRCRADAQTIGKPGTTALLIEMAEMWERLAERYDTLSPPDRDWLDHWTKEK